MMKVSVISVDFKDKLKALRKRRGITQEQLAAELNIPESTIRRYEAMLGTPKRERLELVADYFKVSVDYLIGRTGESSPQETKDEVSELEKKYVAKLEVLTALEHRAKEQGVSPDDPVFKEILAHAFDLAIIARQKNQ